jgi:glycosyltransferase involved in cell wall biosynthesis
MTYGLVAIVKDEGERIEAFLDSAMAVCGVATIVDTGSTDDTIEKIEDYSIHVHRSDWVNFGYNRSEALGLARGSADWLLALDADMTVEIDPGFEPDPEVEAYMIRMGSADFEYRLPLLLRGDLPWESRGAVHEYTCLPDRPYVSRATDQVRVSYAHDRSSVDKSRWHAQMLEADLERDPNNPRTVFYLAQTYWDLHDARMLSTYERRTKMVGWDEETFYAKYRYALCLPSWPARLLALIAAWEFRPSRLEPLHDLVSELNRRSEHFTAYRLASIEVQPTSDVLFVHRGVWRWGMAFERSIAAWWVGEREEARRLCEEVLAVSDLPVHIRVAAERNLSLC